jgi:hypothetical protein
LQRVAQDGSNNLPPVDPVGAGGNNWEIETALDVEWAHAMAPAANIVLVESLNNSYANLLGAVDYAATQTGAVVVSMSWGSGEFSSETSPFYDGRFAGYSNLAFVAASGDSGAPPIWPSVSPNVVSVGGTTLILDSQGNYISESGWTGSGGGISPYESQPAYQNGVVTQSATQRTSPDVAYNANPGTGVYVRFNSGWYAVGGTSAGAPQWAALLAIADQGRAVVGSAPLGTQDTQNALYSLYTSPDFNDIIVGTSTGNPHYSAGPGYDLVTGMGTPNANLVINDLSNWVGGGGGGGGATPAPRPPVQARPSGPNGGAMPPGGLRTRSVVVGGMIQQNTVDTAALAQALLAANSLPPAPPVNLAGVNAFAGRTVLAVADTASSVPAPASAAYHGAVISVGSPGLDGNGTDEGIANSKDDQPAGATPQAAPPAFQRDASPREVPPAVPDAPAPAQPPGLSERGTCDACFAELRLTAAGTNLDASLPPLAVAEDSSAAVNPGAAVATMALVLGGYWGPRAEGQRDKPVASRPWGR